MFSLTKKNEDEMTKSEFKKFLAKIPKTELHIHLEAVITLNGVLKLYKNKFGKEMSIEEQKSLFSYNDLNGFIQAFLKIQGYYSSVNDFSLVFDELEKYLKKNGIVYTEVFFAPSAFLKMGFDYKEMIEIFTKKIAQIQKRSKITIKLLMDVSRTFGLENAQKNYQLLKDFPCEDIIGIGLGGAESKGPAKEFAPVYEQAIKDGFKVVAHAGEDVGPESIWDSINLLHVQRIGHGVTAIQDENLMTELVNSQLPIEICVTSNTFTKKIVEKAKKHPVRNFFDKGMMVALNTDDPVFFKTTLLDEFWICYKQMNFTLDEIKRLVKNSFTSSFMNENEKQDWCKKVDECFN